MKNRKREICTSGSVRDEAGNPLIYSAAEDNFCIWQRAPPCCPRCRAAQGASYPARPVRVIVGFPAGGPTDITARLIGQWLSDDSASNSSSTTGRAPAAISPSRRP